MRKKSPYARRARRKRQQTEPRGARSGIADRLDDGDEWKLESADSRVYSALSEAKSMEKRYFTSDLSILS